MTESNASRNIQGRLAVFETLSDKRKLRKRKRKAKVEASIANYAESQVSDCELVIDDEEDHVPVQKKKYKGVRILEEPLNLKCLWKDCEECYTDYRRFMTHIHSHPFNEYGTNDNDIDCLWNGCEHKAVSKTYLLKHLSYHGHHEKLKHIGSNVISRMNLPECTHETKFIIPDVTSDYTCEWQDCFNYYMTYYEFLQHIRVHIARNPKICKENDICCNWSTCTYKCNTQYKLGDHVKTHTKEKIVACPKCGNMFSTKTKLSDHLKRQMSDQFQSYQCSQCSKLFPNERLLRDHMRLHINHYKCSMCDMTCPKPSSLLRHIRHRHLQERPFKCHLCQHASVTKADLDAHLITHCPEKLMRCEECDYKCRSLCTLERHYQVSHSQGYMPMYECHCCLRKFAKGNLLTKHLIKAHDFYWPSGHSRFRYKVDADGMCRLQTVRYESLEVTQQMMAANNTMKRTPKNFNFKLRKVQSDDKIHKFALVLLDDDDEDEDEQNDNPSEGNRIRRKVKTEELIETSELALMVSNSGDKNVVCSTKNKIEITIDEIDAKGNVIKSETMKSNEMVCVPDFNHFLCAEK